MQNTRIGVAPGVTKAFIGKVLGANGGASDEIVNAIQWAVDQGAHVISMSLGMDFPGFVEFLVTTEGLSIPVATTVALEGYRQNVTLFERLSGLVTAIGPFGQPALIVAAAGNESGRDATPPFESPARRRRCRRAWCRWPRSARSAARWTWRRSRTPTPSSRHPASG